MAKFNEYNYFNKENFSVCNSWILCPTLNHYEGIAVFWNEETNRLACFSKTWPHDGWMEFDEGICSEHEPWECLNDEWQFIGEI